MGNSYSGIFVIGASFFLSCLASAQVTFTGSSGSTAIPDSTLDGPGQYGSPLDYTFNVSGLTANVGDISLSINIRHQWLGDLDVKLIPPAGSGASPLVIFSRVGSYEAQVPAPFGSGATLGADSFGETPGT